VIRHLDNARLELRYALEQHKGSCELDALTRLILEAVRAITAAQRQAIAIETEAGQRSRTPLEAD
jgi:hypothetical protein